MQDFHTERAEESLNALIEKRAQEVEAANAAAAEERGRERRYLTRREHDYRREWADYFRARIELFEELAEENREKLNRLIDGAAW